MVLKTQLQFHGKKFMRGDRVFIDTNIIVYSYTASADKKHIIAMELMKDLWKSGIGVLSTQVLQEFFAVVTKKIPKPLDIASARKILMDLLKWDIIVNDDKSILRAIDVHEQHGYSFWDAMIIESAIRGRCETLLSEDLSDGHMIEGVRIRNPFRGL